MPGSDKAEERAVWRRFRRILRRMAWLAAATAALALLVLRLWIGPLPIHLAIATAIGVFGSVMVAAGLMGLMFASAQSGHDARADGPLRGDGDRD